MSNSMHPTVTLPSGERIPRLGMGTWFMGDHPDRRAEDLSALRRGVDLGMTLIDTAEMYGHGASENLVGEAISGRRDEVFLVSKVLPSHADREGTINACERSLAHLKTDRIDLYLLHWRSSTPFEETIAAFDQLVSAGKIRHWGVSNLDVHDMEELAGVAGGDAVQTNQVLYNLMRRGVEFDLLPRCRERGLPVMAYSPMEQGRLLMHPVLKRLSDAHGATPASIALAWLLHQESVVVIPKAATIEHVEQNAGALDIALSAEDLTMLDEAFPPPTSPQPLEML